MTITLRNVPKEIERAIRRRAEEKGISLNRATIELLEEGQGIRRKPGRKRVYHDLDWMIGSWTKEEADAFDICLKEQRTIDPELWE